MNSEKSLERDVPVNAPGSDAVSVDDGRQEFAMRFTSSRRGARLARRLVSHRLDTWGHPYDSPTNDTVTSIAAELCANAVRHGHVPGRDFHVRLAEVADVVRVEVTDTRTECVPAMSCPEVHAEVGRGLVIVDRLASGWGVVPRTGAPGKTVWAVYSAGGNAVAPGR